MLREESSSAAAEPDLRPLTERWPTQFRRGLYAFKQCPPPPAVKTPLPATRAVFRDVVALRIRKAGQDVGHRHHISRAQGELQAFPAMNMQGALMDCQLYDQLCYFGVKQETGTPRTGASTLIRPMAEMRGWALEEEVPDPNGGPDAVKLVPKTDTKLIDAHAGTIADARWRLEQMGLLGHVRSAVDEHGQERATDWELVDVPEISAEEYEAADAAIERYLARVPAETARPLSARLRGQRFWHFKRRMRLRLTKAVYDRKNRSAPLPTAQAPKGPKQPQEPTVIESSCRAGASTEYVPAGQEQTRDAEPTAPQTNPRPDLTTGTVTEEEGPKAKPSGVLDIGSETAVVGWRDEQQRQDTRQGIESAREVQVLLEGPDLQSILDAGERSALSPKATAKLGATLRLARTRLGLSAEEVSAALAHLMNEDPGRRLSHAALLLRRDLRRHPAMPGADNRTRRREKADRRRATDLEAVELPDFIRTNDHGVPMTWAPDGFFGDQLIACTTLPHDLADPAVRRAIHAAAHRAGITGPQRLNAERSRANSPLAPGRLPVDEQLALEDAIRGNGCIHIIALDGSGAIVPPETSTAAATRWHHNTKPTEHQVEIYTWLRQQLAKRVATTELGPYNPAPATAPRTFAEMFTAIADLLTELYPAPAGSRGTTRPRNTPRPAAQNTDPETARGHALIHHHGSRAAALFATHPDHGGDPNDLRAVLAALGRVGS